MADDSLETLEYTLTLDDHLDFNLHVVKQSSVFRRSRLIWQFLLPAFCLIGYGIGVSGVAVSGSLMRSLSQFEGTEFMLAVALCLLPVLIIGLWIVWYPRLAEKQVRRTMERWSKEDPRRMRFGRTALAITAKGITESSELETHEVDWRAVQKTERTHSHLYVWLDGGRAFIVPRRAFRGDATYREFEETLERLRTSAGDTHRPAG
jgi:hypothetical protein